MLLDIPYEDVYVEVAKVDKKRSRRGLWLTQIKKAALALGHKLTYKRKYDLEEATGILSVTFEDEIPTDHVVVLWKGLIIDTDGTLWDADAYFVLNKAKPTSLLVAD